jgi:site-specific DNA recombinase
VSPVWRRLVIMRGKSKTGNLHFYYFCLGRQRHTCDLPYLHLARVENAVLDNYSTITLPSVLREQIRTRMGAVLTDSAGLNADLRARVADQLAALNSQ